MKKELCDVFIGFRVTKGMKEELDHIVNVNMLSLSDIVRQSLIVELSKRRDQARGTHNISGVGI